MGPNLAEQDRKDDTAAPDPMPAARPLTSAFFFGSAAQPLFGLYGPPQVGPPPAFQDRDHGVLLCAPLAHEFNRTHWCLRLLGDQLIQSGFHVMRFDYSCLGDSWGSFAEASVGQWVADIKTALGELQDNAGVRHISVVGLRLGAALAWTAAQEVPLHHLVLWDPVWGGRGFIDELRSMQTQVRDTWPSAPPVTPGAAQEDLLGYCYHAALVEQLCALEMGLAKLPQVDRVSLVLAAADARADRLKERLSQNHLEGAVRVVGDAGPWAAVEDGLYGEPLLLPNMRRAIVDLLGEPA